MTDKQEPQDLGEPVSYLVLKDGVPVYDASGDKAGEVEHVLSDDKTDVFHGLIVKTAQGHRFARSELVDGLFEHGVIVSAPADQLPEPSEDAAAQAVEDEGFANSLKRAWEWLVQPR
jgi:sporulation protein YlmC with PRC-barrel domain